MKFKLTPESALLSIKIWMHVILCWPLPKDASRKHRILHNTAWCVAVFIPFHSIPASILHSVGEWPDPASLTKNFAETLALFITFTKIVICRVQNSRLQVAIEDVEEFLRTAGPRERAILDRYMSRCGTFYAAVEALCLISSFAFACGPIFLPQPLPGHAEYPFEWKTSPTRKGILYFIHVLICFELCAGAVVDIEIAFLLWVSGIKFELLAECFESARSLKEFNECVEKHQKLLASVHEITIVTKYLILDVILNTGVTNICVGYQFVSHQPIEVMVLFGLMIFISSLEVAMYAWPADNLLTVSESIAHAVYSSPWFDRSQELKSDVRIVMMRSQKPVMIGISGILTAMNLDFCGRYLTTSFSYFTTVRAVVG